MAGLHPRVYQRQQIGRHCGVIRDLAVRIALISLGLPLDSLSYAAYCVGSFTSHGPRP